MTKKTKTNNVETIKDATDKLTKVFYEISEKLYSKVNPNAGAAAGATGAESTEGPKADENGNVYDADYKVEDDNNDNK